MTSYFYSFFDLCKETFNNLVQWYNTSYTDFHSPDIPPDYIKKICPSTGSWTQIYLGNLKGDTGYIDFIDKKFFPNGSNIIYGVDRYNRFFMSILYSDADNINNLQVMTIFERYTNSNNLIVSAGSRFMEDYVSVWNQRHNSMDQQIKDFFTLINKSTVDVEYYDLTTDQKLTKTYKLYDNIIINTDESTINDIELDDFNL